MEEPILVKVRAVLSAAGLWPLAPSSGHFEQATRETI